MLKTMPMPQKTTCHPLQTKMDKEIGVTVYASAAFVSMDMEAEIEVVLSFQPECFLECEGNEINRVS
jgi:hypothetical protein